ncbi:MAG: serine/threonine-protein phosphatase [Verrucomicrobia bacterium]|nr:MAG: serine/threonine-protein phosphatase [Verrucomicrobiota bacterium]
MKLLVHAATDIGRIRQNNEDSYLVDAGRGVFVVADGLGGLEGGEIASQTAVETIARLLREQGPAAVGDLNALFQSANQAVLQAGRDRGILQIGTTLTLAHIEGDRLRIGHVGDSFALLVRDNTCTALTREHNVANDSPPGRDISKLSRSYQRALTRVIGQLEPPRVDLIEETLRPGDWLILATDGLTDCVANVAIAEACRVADDPSVVVPMLVEAALDTSGHDNITVIGVHLLDA